MKFGRAASVDFFSTPLSNPRCKQWSEINSYGNLYLSEQPVWNTGVSARWLFLKDAFQTSSASCSHSASVSHRLRVVVALSRTRFSFHSAVQWLTCNFWSFSSYSWSLSFWSTIICQQWQLPQEVLYTAHRATACLFSKTAASVSP